MNYPNQKVHRDVQARLPGFDNFRLFEGIGGEAVLFHVPSLAVVSTGQSFSEFQSWIKEAKDLSVVGSDDENSSNEVSELTSLDKELCEVKKEKERHIVDIRAVALNVAEQCNLRCVYCYAGEGDYGKNELMPVDVAKETLRYFVKEGVSQFTVVFFGGEPLLNFSLIKEVVEYAKAEFPKTKFHYRMTTNGLLLTSKILDFLSKNNFSLTISYDGNMSQMENRLSVDKKRQTKDFAAEKILKFQSDLQKLDGFKIRTTVTPNAAKSFGMELDDVSQRLGQHMGFNRVASSEEKFSFKMKDAKALMAVLSEKVDELIREKEFEKLLKLDNVAAFIRILSARLYLAKTCGAGLNYLSVSTSGDFYLCHRFTEDSSEKIGSLKDGLDETALEAISSHRFARHEPCSGCWMKNICRGGCFHENKIAHGTKHRPDPIFCFMQGEQITLAIKAFLEIKKHSPELLERKSRNVLGLEHEKVSASLSAGLTGR